MPKLGLGNTITTSSGSGMVDVWSLAFDGSDDYVDITDTDLTGAFTIGAWVKLSTDGGSEEHHLIGEEGLADTFRIDVDNDRLVLRVNGSNYLLTSLPLSLGTWHFVAITRDGSDNAIGYVDTSASSAVGSASGTFSMEKIGETQSTWELEGNISEVFYYNVALTAAQILTIYNQHPFNHLSSSFAGDVQGWWRMGDGSFDDSNVDGNSLITDEANVGLGDNLQNTTFTEDDMLGFTGETATGFTGVNTGTGVGTNDSSHGNALSLTAGHTYKLSWTTTINAGDLSQQLYANVGTTNQGGDGETSTAGTHTAAGNYVNYFKAASTTTYYIVFRLAGNGAYNFTISNVSLRKVDGNPGILVNMTASDFEKDTP